MIKLLVFDLDGTLLHTDKSLSKFTVEVLEKFKKSGGKIAIATGRTITNVTTIAKQIGAEYCISQNGSAVYDGEKIIHQITLDSAKVKDLVHLLTKIENANIAIAYPTKIYTNNQKFVKEGVREYCDFVDFDTNEIQKISVFTSNESAMKKIDFDKYECKLITSIENPTFYIIMQKNANKYNGLVALLNYIGFAEDEVVAFGDDYNDMDILGKIDNSVAVENAADELKKVAHYICGKNDEDGPAKWIYENILQKKK